MKFFDYRRIFLLSLLPWVFVFLFFSFSVKAANVGDVVNFNVDKSFDAYNRIQVPGVLIKITDSLYFYVEQGWWNTKSSDDQMAILSDLDNLSAEFNNKIYPVLTATFGSEWRPGIDNNYRTSVLFESMNSGEGGYFREADEYPKLQMQISNEREMIYVSLDKITDPQVKKILAHEFMHLIAFNQKNQINGVEEDTWLNEARADYSSNVLGYDDVYDRSNLQARVHDFIKKDRKSVV